MNKTILKDRFWAVWHGLPHCRAYRNKMHSEARARLDRELIRDASIIAVNCCGGEISNALGLRFNSPFVNISMERNAFAEMCADMDRYLSGSFSAENRGGVVFGTLEAEGAAPVSMTFPHDSDPAETEGNWERRIRRLNPDKIILITDDKGLDEEHLRMFAGIDCFRKICLTSRKDWADKYECCRLLKEYEGRPQTGTYQAKAFNGLHKFENMWDYVGFLNGGNND